MESLVLKKNSQMQLEEREIPEIGEGEVLLKVGACGICGSDIKRVLGDGAYSYPLVAGHEFAGSVFKAGKGVDSSLIGKKASVFPMLPCRNCKECKTGSYNLCNNYDYFGSRRDGGFAEYIVVPVWNLVFLPDDMPIEIAAMCEPLAVAIHAMLRGKAAIGDNIGIAGAGTIGLMLSRVAKLSGASNVALWDIDESKVKFSKELGNEHTINAKEESVEGYLNKLWPDKLDLVIEGTGSLSGLSACLNAVKKHGTIVLMGNPSGDINLSKADYWKILRSELTLRGTWNSLYCESYKNDWELAAELLYRDNEWFAKLISHRFSLEAGIEPILMMRDKKEFSCKVVYVMGEER